MKNIKISLGQKGEQLVAHYLKQQGYTICKLNYAHRCGEIDIIAEKDEVRAFVEVKLRQTHYFALSEVITPTKRKKIIKTAALYNVLQQSKNDYVYRFDVALLEPTKDDYAIIYIPNAFTQEAQ